MIGVARAAEPPPSIEDLDLGGLLDLFADDRDAEVEVASRTPAGQREAPGIVTVLTAEDLRRAGCLDLLDALRLLPSIELASDVWNTTVPMVRGVLGDARVLVLVDGHEWNELLYGSTSLGNRLPASLIERIEVIRGPGSALYGGFAELAVVKVTTRGGGKLDGGRVDGVATWLPSGAYGRQDLGASIGAALGDHGRIGVSGALGRGRRSDDRYTDVAGHTIDMTDASALDPALLSTVLRLGRFEAAVMGESYQTTREDGGARVDPYVRDDDFSGVYGRASYVAPLSDHVGLRPRVAARWQAPWRNANAPPQSYNNYRETATRAVAGLDLAVEDALPIDLLAGIEGGFDEGFYPQAEIDAGSVDARTARYGLGAAFAQGVLRTRVVDVTGGARLDGNTAYGLAASPRLVLTHAWERFHFKAGVERSYRAPGLVQARSDVGPEHGTTLEAELGVAPLPWAYLTVSAFDLTVGDALVYVYRYDPVSGAETEGYVNLATTGSRGGEADLRLLQGPFRFEAGYALAVADGKNEVPDYAVPGVDGRVLAAPEHKAVVRADLDPVDGLVLGATATVLGPRFAISDRVAGASVAQELPTALLLGAVIEVEPPFAPGLTIGLVGKDLLDANPPFVPGYDSGHLPLPGGGRELGLHVGWER